MSDVGLVNLAVGVQTIPGRPVGSAIDAPFRLSQIISTQGLTESPPTVTVGDPNFPVEMRVVGPIWNYHPGMTIIYQERDGMSCVVGTLANVGSEEDPTEEDFEPWHDIGAAGEPTFQNSWVNFGGAHAVASYFMQTDGWVRLKGLVKNGTTTAGTTIFDLPPGYAPAHTLYFVTIGNGPTGVVIRVTTGGLVQCWNNAQATFTSLAGITFPASWIKDPNDSDNKFFRGHWHVPLMQTGWNMAADTESEVEMFVRSDGWVWWKGVLESGTVPGKAMDLPDRVAAGWRAHLHRGFGFGLSRLDIGGGDPSSNRAPATVRVESAGGSGQDHYVGGINYFGRGAQRLDHFVAGAGDPSLLNGWTDFGSDFQPVRYYKDAHGIVHLMGLANGGSSSSDTIFNLPVGYRPLEQEVFPSIFGSPANSQGRVDVNANGDVVAVAHPNVSWATLEGITFRAMQ